MMSKLFFLFILCGICTCKFVSAQNIEGFYQQAAHAEGLLYFVFPQKMRNHDSGRDVNLSNKPLLYDYTYLDTQDDVTLLITITTVAPFLPDSLVVFTGKEDLFLKWKTEVLYVQTRGKQWEVRTKTQLTFDEWCAIYLLRVVPQYVFVSMDKSCMTFHQDNKREWDKIAARFRKLHNLIQINRHRNDE